MPAALKYQEWTIVAFEYHSQASIFDLKGIRVIRV